MLPGQHLLLPIIIVVSIYRYFLYPENGHIMELPTSENIDEVDIFADLARNK
jgi:hypothetical protein